MIFQIFGKKLLIKYFFQYLIKMYHILIMHDGQVYKNYYFTNFTDIESDKIFSHVSLVKNTHVYFINIKFDINIDSNEELDCVEFEFNGDKIYKVAFSYKEELIFLNYFKFKCSNILELFVKFNFVLNVNSVLW